MVEAGKVGLVHALEVGDVVAPQVGQATPLQRVERLDDTRAAQVDGAKTTLCLVPVVDVLGVGPPALVERLLRVFGDLPNRGASPVWIPVVLD